MILIIKVLRELVLAITEHERYNNFDLRPPEPLANTAAPR